MTEAKMCGGLERCGGYVRTQLATNRKFFDWRRVLASHAWHRGCRKVRV